MKIVMKILMSTCKILCLLVVFMNSLLLDGKSRYSGIAEDEDGNILFGYYWHNMRQWRETHR